MPDPLDALDALFAQTHGSADVSVPNILNASRDEVRRRYGALIKMLPAQPPSASQPPRRPTLSMKASDIVPDALVSPWSREHPGGNPQNAEIDIDNWEPGGGEAYGQYSPMANHIAVNSNAPESGRYFTHPREEILPHEVGHAMWDDLPPLIQKQWETIHSQQVAHMDDLVPDQTQPGRMYRGKIADPAFRQYSDDPSHSWAQAVGEFVGSPEEMQQRSPYIYNWMRSVFGREFKRRTPDEAGITTKVPFNRDAQ